MESFLDCCQNQVVESWNLGARPYTYHQSLGLLRNSRIGYLVTSNISGQHSCSLLTFLEGMDLVQFLQIIQSMGLRNVTFKLATEQVSSSFLASSLWFLVSFLGLTLSQAFPTSGVAGKGPAHRLMRVSAIQGSEWSLDVLICFTLFLVHLPRNLLLFGYRQSQLQAIYLKKDRKENLKLPALF